jgi:hypothetical protein
MDIVNTVDGAAVPWRDGAIQDIVLLVSLNIQLAVTSLLATAEWLL